MVDLHAGIRLLSSVLAKWKLESYTVEHMQLPLAPSSSFSISSTIAGTFCFRHLHPGRIDLCTSPLHRVGSSGRVAVTVSQTRLLTSSFYALAF